MRWIRVLLLALLSSCAMFGELTPAVVQLEIELLAQDVRDAAVIIEDAELQKDLIEFADALVEIEELLASLPLDSTTQLDVTPLMELTDGLMLLDLPSEALLAVLAARTVLRRLAK